MPADDHEPTIAHRFGWPAAIAAVTAAVGLVVTLTLSAALKQHAFWAVAGIAVVAILTGVLSYVIHAGAKARAQIHVLEGQLAEQRSELDHVEVLLARLTRATLPQWLSVAITHTESNRGRVDVVQNGLRFVTAERDGEWTVHLPLSPDSTVWRLERDELHRVLGIDQRSYMAALVDPAT